MTSSMSSIIMSLSKIRMFSFFLHIVNIWGTVTGMSRSKLNIVGAEVKLWPWQLQVSNMNFFGGPCLSTGCHRAHCTKKKNNNNFKLILLQLIPSKGYFSCTALLETYVEQVASCTLKYLFGSKSILLKVKQVVSCTLKYHHWSSLPFYCGERVSKRL